jgi:hypothetical protein
MDRRDEPVNPYTPARASLNDTPPERARRSFADRTSVWLGITGALATASFVVLAAPGAGARAGVEVVGGYLVVVAFAAHAVGIGVVYAAPPGSRRRGLLVNGLAATFLMALVILGLAMGSRVGE